MTYRATALSLIFCGLSLTGYAQSKEYTPEDTEVWKPVPEVVAPGEQNHQPPADAIVLFDGTDLSAWEVDDNTEWNVHDGVVTIVPSQTQREAPINIRSKTKFGDMQLHLEWMAPEQIEGDGQRRGNSGVFLQERYELQIQDNYENATYANGQAASIYKQQAPLVNACRRPGEWQTYDVFYTAPTFDEIGLLLTSRLRHGGTQRYSGTTPY